MKEKKVVGDMSEWSGMLADFFRQIGDGSKTKLQFLAFLENRNPFAITDIKSEWQEFYQKYFRMMVDFSDVVIPENPGGFDRAIFIPKGLTFASVVKDLRKKTNVYLYVEDLDRDVTENVRVADHNYAIRIRERQEADEELKNLSANQLKERGDNYITLLERLVYELKYFSETGQHLDINNITLCAGSRDSDGDVPSVDWHSDDGLLHVFGFYPDSADVDLRARQVVSK